MLDGATGGGLGVALLMQLPLESGDVVGIPAAARAGFEFAFDQGLLLEVD